MKSHRCFNLDDEGKVKRLSAEKLSRMEKGKAKVGDEASEGADQQQSKEYLPTYLKKVEDEMDEPETTIEELEEVYLDKDDPDKKVLVGTLLSKKREK